MKIAFFKNLKKTLFLLLVLFFISGLYGCNIETNKNNKDDIVTLAYEYIYNKYSIDVDLVEQIVPQNGFNSALKENVLVMSDPNGLIFNVRSRIDTPSNFYDDYVETCTAASVQKEIGVSVPSGSAKIYVVVNNDDASNINASPTNIASLTFISVIKGYPNDNSLERLYEIYDNIQQRGYSNIYFLVGFTDGSSEFEKAVENYMVHGKSEWKDYSGEVFAELYVTDSNLTFDEFANKLNKT